MMFLFEDLLPLHRRNMPQIKICIARGSKWRSRKYLLKVEIVLLCIIKFRTYSSRSSNHHAWETPKHKAWTQRLWTVDGVVYQHDLHPRKVCFCVINESKWFTSNSTELECWSHAAESLKILSDIYANSKTLDTMGRVNRLISTWPTDDTVPAEGLGYLQGVQGKLTSGLTEIMNSANQEVK